MNHIISKLTQRLAPLIAVLAGIFFLAGGVIEGLEGVKAEIAVFADLHADGRHLKRCRAHQRDSP